MLPHATTHPRAENMPRVERVCNVCSDSFMARGSQVLKGRAKYCSRTCFDARNGSTLEQRFWAFVEKSEACWMWTGRVNHGYGRFRFYGNEYSAHRFSYELHKGEIPETLVIDHLCRVTLCVNPDHLEVVTNVENVMRGYSRSAVNARKTHCIRGHALDDVNTFVAPNGSRHCRLCERERRRHV